MLNIDNTRKWQNSESMYFYFKSTISVVVLRPTRWKFFKVSVFCSKFLVSPPSLKISSNISHLSWLEAMYLSGPPYHSHITVVHCWLAGDVHKEVARGGLTTHPFSWFQVEAAGLHHFSLLKQQMVICNKNNITIH